MAQRDRDVARGMQDIGGNDDIERAGGEALRCRIALYIQRVEPHEPVLGDEILAACGHEADRDIGVVVFDFRLCGGQCPQDGGRCPTRAGADFQHPDRSANSFGNPCESIGEDCVEMVSEMIAFVDRFHEVHAAIGEHDLGGGDLPGQ